VKRDDRREVYSREKLEKGLRRALEKRTTVDGDRFKQLVNNIERDIQVHVKNKKTGPTIGSEDIGDIVMKNLKKVDKVAYIRFASVYKSFTDAEEFASEIKGLLSNKKKTKN
jgi:transcriptional repressor NrdR